MSSPTENSGDRSPEAAVLTPSGRGAVATIRLSGAGHLALIEESSAPLFRAPNGRPLSSHSPGRVVFGLWGEGPGEEVVACRVDECVTEIHCHGGRAAVNRILDDLTAVGFARCDAADVVAGSRFDQECLTALTQATTVRTAAILLEQQTGVLRTAVERLISLAGSPASTPDGTLTDCSELISSLDGLLEWAEFGRHLTSPWTVVLAGRPNAGKSSLINALLGFSRSIVSEQPGTTRDVVAADTAWDGWPLRFLDTAGLRETAEQLESLGIGRTRRHLAEADCRIILLDISEPPNQEDQRLIAEWPDALIVAHKSDLSAVRDDIPAGALPVSSLQTTGIEELLAAITGKLVPRNPPPETAVPISPRQVKLLAEARAAAIKGNRDESFRSLRQLLD